MRAITSGMSQWRAQRCTGKNLCSIGTVQTVGVKIVQMETPIEPGTYTISALITSDDTDNTRSYIAIYDDAGNNIAGRSFARGVRESYTFTATQIVKSVYLYPSTSYNWSLNDNATFADIQIERGSVATEYEPYCGGGEHIVASNCKGGYFSVLPDYGLRVMGRTAQDGVPTPESPVPIRCVKAGTKVRCCGKNLFNNIFPSRTINGVTFETSGDGSVHVFGTALKNTWWNDAASTSQTFRIDAGTYTVKTDYNNVSVYCTGKYLDGRSTGDLKNTFTVTEPCSIALQAVVVSGKTVDTTIYPQLERGSAETAYAPYVESEITVPCDLYEGDVWYPMTGAVEGNSYRFEVPLSDWTRNEKERQTYFDHFVNGLPIPKSTNVIKNAKNQQKCSHARIGNPYSGETGDLAWFYSQNGTYIRLSFRTIDSTFDMNTFLTYLQAQKANGTPVEIVYETAEPILKQYDPQPIFAPSGVVNLLQVPTDVAAKLETTLMVRR